MGKIIQIPQDVSRLINGRHLVLFDGYCTLCNSSVDFIARRNSKNKLVFASLQSAVAKQLLGDSAISLHDPDSIIFIEDANMYQESTAALRIAKYLDQPYPIIKFLLWVPLVIRDCVYCIIAKNRYKWFGKKNTCRIPTDAEREMFLD